MGGWDLPKKATREESGKRLNKGRVTNKGGVDFKRRGLDIFMELIGIVTKLTSFPGFSYQNL